MEHAHEAIRSRKNSCSDTPRSRQILVATAFIYLGLTSDCFAFTVTPTALTFQADQGATNPPHQTLFVDKNSTAQTTLTNSEDASWLTVSPSKTSMTSTAQLTVAVNTSGLAAGTYKTAISIKAKQGAPIKVPVTLMVLPSSEPLPSPTAVTLSWNPVTDPTLGGYNVHVGTESGVYTRMIPVGSLTSYTVDSLTLGTTYFFAVTSYNSAGESQPSNEVSKSIY